MARSTSTAATEESTPPERAQMARPSPTCSRIAETVDWMNCAGVQLGWAWQMLKEEVAQQVGSSRCVADLGVKLHRPDIARGIGHAGHGIGGARGQGKAGRQFQGFIPMRHPDIERWGQTGKQRDFQLPGNDRNLRGPVFALFRRAYLAA